MHPEPGLRTSERAGERPGFHLVADDRPIGLLAGDDQLGDPRVERGEGLPGDVVGVLLVEVAILRSRTKVGGRNVACQEGDDLPLDVGAERRRLR
jgi:hypothetical protein